jgi:exonuclease SbcC
MKLESITLRGFGPFTSEVSVDLSAVTGRIIAVTGENGSGKSTLLELWSGGALYRSTATRGSLGDLATARDAFLEARVQNGASYTVRHTVDARNGKGESIVLDADGASLIASAKVRDFDRFSAAHFPTPEVLYSTVVAPQGAAGFLGMRAGERKAVLLRVLGIERLERMADTARERARTAKAAYTTAAARLADEQARGGSVSEAEAEMSAARKRQMAALEDLELSRAALAAAEQSAQQAQESRREYEALELRRAELNQRIEAARAEGEQLEGRIANNRGLLGKAEAIRSALARVPSLVQELAELGAEQYANDQAQEHAAVAKLSAKRLTQDAQKRAQAAQARVRAASGAAALRAKVEASAAMLPDLEAAHVAAAAAYESACAELERLQGMRAAGAEQRIVDLRTGLELVRDGCDDAPRVARGALDLDGGRILLAQELPAQTKAAVSARLSASTAAERARVELEACRATAARWPEADRLESEARAADDDLVEAAGAVVKSTEDAEAADKEIAKHQRRADELAVRGAALKAERATLEPLCKLGDRLTQAEARIAELQPQADNARAEALALTMKLAALPVPKAPPLAPDSEGARRAVVEAEAIARDAAGFLAVAEQKLKTACQSSERVRALKVETDASEDELSDWTRLADDLGRDGIQAVMLDAAGPELTELTNDLLHNAFGPRFSVRFDTLRSSADGKKQIEAFDIAVIDTLRGRDGNAESLSGGERVIISEAISLALTTMSCNRVSMAGSTMIRDESGAALDPENARAYVTMCRRALDLVGGDKMLLVSHSTEVQGICDARIEISNGKIEVSQ